MNPLLPCGRKNPTQEQQAPNSENWKVVLNRFLKSKGLRSTVPIERVSEIALSQRTHFEIQELIKEVQVVYPEISPATVYRSVGTLCEAGLLNETLQSTTGVTLYEAHDQGHHHDHVVCLDCGKIFEFHDESLEAAQVQAIRKMNFEQTRHQHVIYAHCTFKKK